MAYTLTCRVEIGDFVLRSVNACEIVSTWKELSDRCTLKIPSRGVVNASGKLRQVSFEQRLRVGAPVKVQLGYDEDLNTEFEGFVAEIKPGFPFELRCEDRMWTLKREGNITKSYRKAKVADILRDLVPGVVIDKDSPDVTIDNFLVERATKARVLQELKEKYGMAIYFRGPQLYAGLPYFDRINEVAVYDMQRNVADDGLQYRRAEDVRLKAKVVSILKNNRRITVEEGDADGDERTIHYYDIEDSNELRKRAKSELERYKYEGYRGSLTGFGLPVVRHGQIVELRDRKFSERNGRYLADSVRTTFGTGGFRREVELAMKVAGGTIVAPDVPLTPREIELIGV
jgi:hypothetical protein